MKDSDFSFLQSFLLKRSGANLWTEKRYFADVRLAALARTLALADTDALLAEVRHAPDGEVALRVVEGLTTNETFFFRDSAPFHTIESVLLPALARTTPARRTIRIWCAAVAAGQEAYSIALLCLRHKYLLNGIRLEILGTDMSRDMIDRARVGRYSHFEVQRGLPIQVILEHFQQQGDDWQIAPDLRTMVDFRVMNLLDDSPGLGRFDLILLRNVLVYLDTAIKAEVLARVARHLAPDGLLLLGAAESALGLGEAVVPHPVYRGFYGLTVGAEAQQGGAPSRAPADPRGPAIQTTQAARAGSRSS